METKIKIQELTFKEEINGFRKFHVNGKTCYLRPGFENIYPGDVLNVVESEKYRGEYIINGIDQPAKYDGINHLLGIVFATVASTNPDKDLDYVQAEAVRRTATMVEQLRKLIITRA